MEDAFTARDGWTPGLEEIKAAANMLRVWGGLRNRDLDSHFIVVKMLVAAHNASHPIKEKLDDD